MFGVFGVVENEKRRDAEIPTALLKEKNSRNRRTVECMRAMCFLLGVWYLVTD